MVYMIEKFIKIDFSDINNIQSEVFFNAGNNNVNYNYYVDENMMIFGVQKLIIIIFFTRKKVLKLVCYIKEINL